jgi:hypothetical protein
MKRVIDKKLYDTDDAEVIASYCPVADRGDFAFLKETLYQTDKGRYFLFGEGGAKTKYAVSTGDGKTSGKEIEPLSEDEALEWCEQRSIDGTIVVGEFAEQIEDA